MENTLNTTIDIDRVLELKLRNHGYDFVLIDPPPSFGRVNAISLMASSAMIIPTQLSAYPIRALEYVFDRIDEIQQLKKLQILGIAVSMYDQRSSSFNLSMREKILELLQVKELAGKVDIFPEKTWIPRLNIISTAQDKGYPIHEVEFDDTLTSVDKEAAEKTIERYTELARHLIQSTQGDV
jgi:cellulose biosynthesis protein BcsQ